MPISLYWKQRIVQLYSDSDCSYGDIERVLRHEGKIVPKKTIWAIIKKYKEHGTIGRLAGSGRQPKLTAEVLALVEAKMRSDDETTAVHLVKHLKENGFDLSKTSAIRARTLLEANRQSENVKSQTRKRETLISNSRKGKRNVSAKINEKRKQLRLTAIIVTFFSVCTVC